MKSKALSQILTAMTVAGLASCSGGNGWTVAGTVDGASDSTIYIEGSTAGGWYTIDSVKVSGNGSFKYRAAEGAETPSVFRLRMADKYIYFPIDSVEEVTIITKYPGFDTGYHLAGNIYASGFAQVDSLVNAAVAANGAEVALTDPVLKRSINLIINQDTTALVAYYAVGKTIAGKPLYSLTDKSDLRMVANAANIYNVRRPNDQRGKELEQRWMAGRRAIGAIRGVNAEAELISRPKADLKRFDAQGKEHDFDKVVTRGTGPTILSLTCYTAEQSPAVTAALKQVYNAYHNAGLEIFQVSYDSNEVDWKRSAANMPWIAVWNGPRDNVEALFNYNADPINGAPVTFVFNRAGELVERVSDPSKIAAAVAKVAN